MARVEPDVRDLVAMSHAVGRDGTLVQGGGGNTSTKSADGEFMLVKASGTTLKGMTSRIGFRKVRLQPVLDLVADASLLTFDADKVDAEVRRRLTAACVDDRPGLPSVETSLHALLGSCVVHVHPSATNGLLCARNGRETIDRMFGREKLPIVYVPWRNPGVPLARSVASALSRYERTHGRGPAILFLQNHGIFLSGDDTREPVRLAGLVNRRVIAHWEKAHKKTHARVLKDADRRRITRAVKDVMRDFYSGCIEGPLAICATSAPHVREFVSREDAPKLLNAGPLTPDHLAYARGAAFWLDPDDGRDGMRAALESQILARRRKQSSVPRTVAVKGVGLFSTDASPALGKVALAVSGASLLTLMVAAEFGGVEALSRRAAAYIEGWENEEFRRQVAVGSA